MSTESHWIDRRGFIEMIAGSPDLPIFYSLYSFYFIVPYYNLLTAPISTTFINDEPCTKCLLSNNIIM